MPASRSSFWTIFRPALPGRSPRACRSLSATAAIRRWSTRLIRQHRVDAIIHFAASVVVPESVSDPLRYYRNNTVNTRALIECAVNTGVRHFIFSSTAAVYGDPAQIPVPETAPPQPVSPYGWSKLMSEVMLRDAGHAHGLRYTILRYFNVAGADPRGRAGQSSKDATHLIKVAIETAVGARDKLQIFGADYPTPDGTCVRDYIHVSDLVRAHSDALAPLAFRRAVADAQLRLRSRLFRARGDRHGQARVGRRFSRRDRAAAPRRPGAHRCRFHASAGGARLAATLRRSVDNRHARARLGARIDEAARRAVPIKRSSARRPVPSGHSSAEIA